MPLNEINVSDPAGSEAANTVDDQIRALKQDVKESFHGNDSGSGAASGYSEHYGQGQHKFPRGDGTFPALPGVPAVGNAGRLFLDTVNGGLLRDDGTIWRLLKGRFQYNTNLAGVALTTSYQSIVTASVNVPNAANLLVLGIFRSSVATGNANVTWKVTDGVSTFLPTEMLLNHELTAMVPVLAFLAVPSVGDVTVDLQVKRGAGTVTVDDAFLVAICL